MIANGSYRDRSRALEEISGAFLRSVRKRQERIGDAAPLDPKRFDHGSHKPQGLRYVETVRNREDVEHRADVLQLEDRRAFVQIDFNSIIRNLYGPD